MLMTSFLLETADNYTTAVVGNLSIHWINKVVAEDPTRPFFAYVQMTKTHYEMHCGLVDLT